MADIAKSENLGISIDYSDSDSLLDSLIKLYEEPMNVKLKHDWTTEVKDLVISYSNLRTILNEE